jgi:sugar fermentation stimulation protein A
MEFQQSLRRGRLVQRYKRFFADVIMDDGTEITAHCPNPGAMLGLNIPGLTCWLSKSDNPKRKLAHTLELVEVDGSVIGINTMSPHVTKQSRLMRGDRGGGGLGPHLTQHTLDVTRGQSPAE